MSSDASHTKTGWIAVDWGTSRLRIWIISPKGDVVSRLESDCGAGALEKNEFEPTLTKLISNYLNSDCSVPVVICGMAGSRQGWQEAHYADVPHSLKDIANLAISVETSDERINVVILPGICQRDKITPDVIRGEETQLLGLATKIADFDGLVCLPGTHSKWVELQGANVGSIRTYLTGEMYHLLCRHSILRHTVGATGTWDESGFVEGVEQAKNSDIPLMARLFALRAHDLLFEANSSRATALLSGLLIGNEICNQLNSGSVESVALLGEENLAKKYQRAMQVFSVDATIHNSEDLTLLGLKSAYSKLVRNSSHGVG